MHADGGCQQRGEKSSFRHDKMSHSGLNHFFKGQHNLPFMGLVPPPSTTQSHPQFLSPHEGQTSPPNPPSDSERFLQFQQLAEAAPTTGGNARPGFTDIG